MKKIFLIVILLLTLTVLCFGKGKQERAPKVVITGVSFDYDPTPTELEGAWKNTGKNQEGTYNATYTFTGNAFSCTNERTINDQTEEINFSGIFVFFNDNIVFDMNELNGEPCNERWSQRYTLSDEYINLARDAAGHINGYFINHDRLVDYDPAPSVFEGSWKSTDVNNEGSWDITYTFTGNKFSCIDVRTVNGQRTEAGYCGFFSFEEKSITFTAIESNGMSTYNKWTQRHTLTDEYLELIRLSNRVGGKFFKQ